MAKKPLFLHFVGFSIGQGSEFLFKVLNWQIYY